MAMFVERSQVLGIITPPGMGAYDGSPRVRRRPNNFLGGPRARKHAFLGDPYGSASTSWSSDLASGKLLPVADNFMGWGACAGGGCAFDPNDPGTIYLTKVTSFGGSPPSGYRIGPKTSAVSWTGTGPAPWPGTGPDSRVYTSSGGVAISSPTGNYSIPSGPNTFYPQPPSGSFPSSGSYPAPYSLSPQPPVTVSVPAQQGISPLWIAAGVGGAALIFLAFMKRKKKPVFTAAPAPAVSAPQPASPVATA